MVKCGKDMETYKKVNNKRQESNPNQLVNKEGRKTASSPAKKKLN